MMSLQKGLIGMAFFRQKHFVFLKLGSIPELHLSGLQSKIKRNLPEELILLKALRNRLG
jgi:hypothetical protein